MRGLQAERAVNVAFARDVETTCVLQGAPAAWQGLYDQYIASGAWLHCCVRRGRRIHRFSLWMDTTSCGTSPKPSAGPKVAVPAAAAPTATTATRICRPCMMALPGRAWSGGWWSTPARAKSRCHITSPSLDSFMNFDETPIHDHVSCRCARLSSVQFNMGIRIDLFRKHICQSE